MRVGGQYRLLMMKLPKGDVFYLTGTYREVRPPERLMYTWRWEAEPELGETLVTVEFHDRGGLTEVVLPHELFPTEKARGARAGLEQQLRQTREDPTRRKHIMANATVKDLRTKTDAAWANLTRQLQGMGAYMERSDAPGEWTTRQVLSHLLFEPGWNAVHVLEKFSATDLPVMEIIPGQVSVTPERKKMTLAQFLDALDAQRRDVFAYLEGLSEAALTGRKARIPLFKQFMGTDEIPISTYVGALFDLHWNDHAGQLAKIRKAAGLPEAK